MADLYVCESEGCSASHRPRECPGLLCPTNPCLPVHIMRASGWYKPKKAWYCPPCTYEWWPESQPLSIDKAQKQLCQDCLDTCAATWAAYSAQLGATGPAASAAAAVQSAPAAPAPAARGGGSASALVAPAPASAARGGASASASASSGDGGRLRPQQQLHRPGRKPQHLRGCLQHMLRPQQQPQ